MRYWELHEAAFDRYHADEKEHAADLAGVEAYAASLGVELRVSNNLPKTAQDHRNGAGWALGWVNRTTGEPGAAVKAIQHFIDVADRWKQKIALMVMNDEDRDNAPLVAYYERLGFKVTGRNREGIRMVRAAGGNKVKAAPPPYAEAGELKPGVRVCWSIPNKRRPGQKPNVVGTVTGVDPFEVPGGFKAWVDVRWDDGVVTDGVHNTSLSLA